MKKKELIINILIPLFIGGISAYMIKDSTHLYQQLNLPPLALPYLAFPIIWTILYILMGISSYFIYISEHANKESALIIYAFQLIVNFAWPLTFFNYQNFFLSLMILIVLIILVIIMFYCFYRIKPLAAYLNIPYLIWLFFALYLNFYIFLYN